MNIFLKLLYAFVGEPSADRAVKEIDKAIKKLEKAVGYQADKAEKARLAANAAMAANKAAIEEADRARRVHTKMSDLLS